MAREKTARMKKKERKNIAAGVCSCELFSFNNTKILIADAQGNAIAWSSAGTMGFKGSRKSTPYAAQMAAEDAGRRRRSMACDARGRSAGPGFGPRMRAARAGRRRASRSPSIRDVTPIAHNGCRPPKRRRV